MATIKENIDANIESRIDAKESMYSVSKEDVTESMRDLLKYLGATPANEDLFYDRGLFVYTLSPMAVYVSKQQNVSGDVTDQANWLKITSEGLPYLVSGTDVVVTVVPYQPSNYYVPYSIDLAEDTGKLIDLRLSGIAATNTAQLAYTIALTTAGSVNGSSVMIKTDTKGVGMHLLTIDGTYSERLASGGTYIFTKTTDVDDADGYIITKIAQEGIKTITASPMLVSPGKFLASSGGIFQLPLAAGIGGEVVELIFINTNPSPNTIGNSGSDTLVNIGGLGYLNVPSMKFTSDGIDKWYYTI